MRHKLLHTILTLLLVFTLPLVSLYGGISNNVQFDVATTGNDANGGGFVTGATGTDFSQQDAAQYTFTDLASANGSTNPCTVTSASHNFVASDVGNLMNITAGTNFLTGAGVRYQIVSVAANAATLDRACGSAASISGGTYAVGGRMATIGGAAAIADSTTSMQGGASAGAIINIKSNANYVLTATVNIGSNTNIAFVGYQTTHGDNGTPPTVTTATNGTPLFTIGARSYTFDNFIFTTSAGTPAAGLLVNSGVMLGVRNASFSGFTNGINATNTETDLVGVEVKNSTGVGVLASTGTILVCYGCWIHNNTGNGIAAGHPIIVMSIVSAGTAQGVNMNAGPSTGACLASSIANNGTDGWNATGASFTVADCIFYGNGGFGVHGPNIGLSSNVIPVNIGRNNGYGNNASGDLSGYTAAPGTMNGTTKALNDFAFTSNPFTTATNFALNGTAGGGAAAKQTGWPGAFPTAASTGFISVGAVQPAATSSNTGFCKMR